MNFKAKLSRVAIAVAVSAGLAGTAIAQETSSGIRGTIAVSYTHLTLPTSDLV